MPSPVVHFEVTGSDGNKLRDFYSKVFGWQFNVMPEMDYGMVDNGGRGINGGIGSGQGPSALFYVAVPDPQDTLNKIESKGGKTAMPVTEIPGVVTFAQFTDPEGNRVGLVKDDGSQPPTSAAPAENPVTWFEVAGKDSNRLRAFYSDIFGWQINVMPEMDYGMVDNKGQGIDGGVAAGEPPHAIFYVEVAEPQAFMDKVTSAGGSEAMPVTDGGMVTFAHFKDPEGNLVGLFKSNQPA
jgi:predicted enzyme related to lactoylglutathione lyase